MQPTIRTLMGLSPLAIRLRAGSAGIDRPVRWVSVSELEDPTPYLEGGELVLTTGLRLTAANAATYVRLLVAASASGLGVGIGLTHTATPPELIVAAEESGLPLLEIPEPTPFMAVSKAVFDLLAADEYEAVTRTVASQRDLTRAALAPEGAAAVATRLASELAATVLLVDPVGGLIHQAGGQGPDALGGAPVARLLDEVRPELERLRERGQRSSASLAFGDQAIVLQPVAATGRARGFLVVARGERLAAGDLALVNVAVALVSLVLERSVGSDATRRNLRSAVLSLLVNGVGPGQLPLAEIGWQGLTSTTFSVRIGDGPSRDLAATLEQLEGNELGGPSRWAAMFQNRLVVLEAADSRNSARDREPGTHQAELAWGISDDVSVVTISDGLRQAGQALAAAKPGGARRFGDLASGGLLGLFGTDAAAGFADGLLAPLDAQSRGDLVASTHAWLTHNGQWDAAAQSLGVHRHTLRYRMRRVEDLLGRPLQDPDLRAELWVALAIRDRAAAP